MDDCSKVKQVSPTCPKTCPSNGSEDISKKYKSTSSYSVSSEDELKTELYTNGPVTVAFTV